MLLYFMIAVILFSGQGSVGKLLTDHLQIDDVDSGKYDDLENLPENSCTRTCVSGEHRTCYYRFVLEPYSTLSKACVNCTTDVSHCYYNQCVTADGFEREVLTVNRRMPGPSIQVCEGDTIVVDVKNAMPGRSTAIHWHGLRMKDSKFMDGVPMVTQCPIMEGQIFRYTYKAERGLHFYHSHDGLQKVDGLLGSLVVRQPKDEDPNGDEYDFDLPPHVIVIQDWYHLVADSMFPGLRYHDTDQMGSSYLIQGRGQYIMQDGYRLANTPLAEFKVIKDNRYVFRFVGGTCYECQFVLTVESHKMKIIGADANPTEPYEVDSLTMSSGERYSVVINCNQPVGAYWIQVRSVGLCEKTRANQVAVLVYNGASRQPTSPAPTFSNSSVNRIGLTMSPVNSPCTEESKENEGPCLHDLRSAEPVTNEDILKESPTTRVFLAFGFYFFTLETLLNNHYPRFLESPFGTVGSTINGIANMASPSPLLSQPENVPPNILCPEDGFDPTTWNIEHRECVHIIKVAAGTCVELVIINVDDFGRNFTSHPVHLHGYDMYVLEMGVLRQGIPYNEAYLELVSYLNSTERRTIPERPLLKDTFPLTAGGYIVARIYTDNPGFWYFHCHFAYHLDSGMSGILQVGENSTFPSPPTNFPKCGDFLTWGG